MSAPLGPRFQPEHAVLQQNAFILRNALTVPGGMAFDLHDTRPNLPSVIYGQTSTPTATHTLFERFCRLLS